MIFEPENKATLIRASEIAEGMLACLGDAPSEDLSGLSLAILVAAFLWAFRADPGCPVVDTAMLREVKLETLVSTARGLVARMEKPTHGRH
jgi:hypothetical protein